MAKNNLPASNYAKPHTMNGGPVDMNGRNVNPNTRAAKDVSPETEAMDVSIGGKESKVEKEGIVTRGNGCATKGITARGPLA
jgi:hypothetical protein